MIEVNGLSYKYSAAGVPAIKSISLAFPEKGVVSLLGPNGSGKSTFLKCLAGIIHVKDGEITIEGEDITRISAKKLSVMQSYVPQNFIPTFGISVYDFVMLGRLPHIGWIIGNIDKEIVSDSIALFGLEKLTKKSVLELSIGQQQLVSIARAFAQGARTILMDEPLSALDLGRSIEIMEIVCRAVRDNHALVICVMHDISMAARYSDTVIVMKDGASLRMGKPEDVVNQEMLKSVYQVDGRVWFDEYGCRIGWKRETPFPELFRQPNSG
jgi:iron complex transport system ATP-binding protein